jgi:hypothetical protein
VGRELTLHSADSVSEDDDESAYPIEFLNNINSGSIPPHELRLKEGVIVILMVNLNRATGRYHTCSPDSTTLWTL